MEEYVNIRDFEFKAGMVIEMKDATDYVVFPLENELAVISYSGWEWRTLNNFLNDKKEDIAKIMDFAVPGEGINRGNILWKRPEEIEITMREIADKFGVPVGCIKITK